MNYKYLIFDLDETLFDFKMSEQHALKKSCLEFNIPYEDTTHLTAYKKINKSLWAQLEKGCLTQEELKIQRFIEFKHAMSLNYNPTEFAHIFMHHLSQGSYLLKGAENLIKSLSNHYKLIILTNGLTHVQKKRIKHSPIAHYFEDFFISEEIGMSKPNPALFEYVFTALSNKNSYFHKNLCLMIGDSLTSDIQGGINAGIDTCWVNLNQKINKTPIIPTYEVSTLIELEMLLK